MSELIYVGHAENILRLFNNLLLLISMNIAISNWISYNFQVGREVELKLKSKEE